MIRQIPLLLLSALFVIAGAWRIVEAGADDGWAAVCVGCVLIGSWLTIELYDHWHPAVDLAAGTAVGARPVDAD